MILALLLFAALNSYQADTTKQSGVDTYRADGTVLGGSADRMALRSVVCDSIIFDSDSLAVIQLNKVPTQTKRRTAPTSADKLQVVGAYTISSYDAKSGKVTIKALFVAGSTPMTVTLTTQ